MTCPPRRSVRERTPPSHAPPRAGAARHRRRAACRTGGRRPPAQEPPPDSGWKKTCGRESSAADRLMKAVVTATFRARSGPGLLGKDAGHPKPRTASTPRGQQLQQFLRRLQEIEVSAVDDPELDRIRVLTPPLELVEAHVGVVPPVQYDDGASHRDGLRPPVLTRGGEITQQH